MSIASEFANAPVPAPTEARPPAVVAPAAPPTLSERARVAAAEHATRPMSTLLLAGVVQFGEAIGLMAIGLTIAMLYVDDPVTLFLPYLSATATVAVAFTIVEDASNAYGVGSLRHPLRSLGRVWLGWAGVLGLFTLVIFFGKLGEVFSRVWLAAWFVGGAVALGAGRVLIAGAVNRWTREGKLERRAVVVGGGAAAQAVIDALAREPDNDIRICGVFDDRGDDRSPAEIAGHPKLGTISELVEFGRLTRLDMLIITLPITAEQRLLQLLRKLWVLPVDIRLSAHANKLKFRPRAYSYVGTVPFLDVLDKPLADWDGVAKRCFDLVFASLALVLLAPVMLVTALAIKLESRGPVFFKQKRYGFNNELVEVWKFRSMYADQTDQDAAKLVSKGDPRVTRVGRFIRRTSIDELPQLFNVIAGTLSLVGPRPHAISAKAANRLYVEVVDSYFARHKVKPGVTGWAQINGWRGETDTDEKIEKRVEHDLYYIENWSLGLDLYILFATPFRLLDGEQAY